MMRPSYRLHANKLAGWRAALGASASLVLGLTLHAGPVLADPASLQDSRAGQGQGGQDSAVSGTEGDLSAPDASGCWRVQGHLVERLVPPGECSSPVGLCTIARMFGGLKGDALFIANEFISSTDTPVTGVVFVIGDIFIDEARVGRKRGALTLKSAAGFRTIGDNDLVDIQTIIGGTHDFAGATGTIRIRGAFPAGGGTSTYVGSVCVPRPAHR
jgi:hypothetical protein